MTQLCPITLDPGNELVCSAKILDQNRHACQRVLVIRKAIEPFPHRTFAIRKRHKPALYLLSSFSIFKK